MSEPGRVAAVDYGRRRIGMALSDPLRITVRGLPTLDRLPDLSALDAAARRVSEILSREGALLVIVGLPLHADGRESEMSAEVRRFGAALASATPIEITYFDEGLTSWEAEEGLKARRKPLKDARRDGDIDQASAIVLLRSWLAEPRPPELPCLNIKLMPDYHCFPLWKCGGDIGNVDPNTLPISLELKQTLAAWAEAFDSSLNFKVPQDPVFASPADERAFFQSFDTQGHVLWQRLRRELGPTYRVTYFSQKDHKVHEWKDSPGQTSS